jgi:uncharacterized protein YvpB
MSEEKRNRLFSNQDYIEKIVCLTKKYTLMSSEDYTQELPQTALFNQMEEYSEAFQRCDSTTKRRLARQVTEVVNEVTPGYFAKDKKTRGNQMLDMFHATIPYTKKTNQQVYSMTGSDIASIATSLQSENMPGINPAIS